MYVCILENTVSQFVRFQARCQKTCRACLSNFCLCFFRLRKAINNIPILHSQPTVAGFHYEENPPFPIILIPIPTLSAVADRKIRNTHVVLFCAPAKNPVGAHASEIVHVFFPGREVFFKFRENTLLMGMVRCLHYLLRRTGM